MKVIAIIPARMGSSRFPGKPMAKINGQPMIGMVYQKVIQNKMIKKTVVATCDKIIFNYIKSIGGNVIMTSKKHKRASDRSAEALKKIEKKTKEKFDIILMVQGDEPMLNKEMITESLAPFKKDNNVEVVNLLGKFDNLKEFKDKNSIKVLCDKENNAIYFGRQLSDKIFFNKSIKLGKQVCIIPFKREILFKYLALPPSGMEIEESIDMWRLIENSIKVKMIKTKYQSYPVDTQKDLNKVSKLLR